MNRSRLLNTNRLLVDLGEAAAARRRSERWSELLPHRSPAAAPHEGSPAGPSVPLLLALASRHAPRGSGVMLAFRASCPSALRSV